MKTYRVKAHPSYVHHLALCIERYFRGIHTTVEMKNGSRWITYTTSSRHRSQLIHWFAAGYQAAKGGRNHEG